MEEQDMARVHSLNAGARTREWREVTPKMLREQIIPLDRPAVLKGLVKDWPIVRAAAESPEALGEYLRARDRGRPVRVMLGAPQIGGVYFFRDDLSGLNFENAHRPVHEVYAAILACRTQAAPPAIYTGAAALEDTVPALIAECPLTVLDKPARPRLWLGNAVTAATHYDNSDGINCIVAGRKRFTFFPPEQFCNLYVGPLELGPGGQPTSLVRVTAPDLERYPRYAEALAAAETAQVEPGDAIYIPNLWWHNVESLEAVNLSVNFWWFDAGEWAAEPFAALAHTLLAMDGLPESRREVWRKMFEHYAFRSEGEPVPYLPMERRGILGTLTAKIQEHMRVQVIRSLTKRMSPELGGAIRRLLWEARAQGEGR
jgi:hypothetical protein